MAGMVVVWSISNSERHVVVVFDVFTPLLVSGRPGDSDTLEILSSSALQTTQTCAKPHLGTTTYPTLVCSLAMR